MTICKKCLFLILSNTMLALMIYFLAALAFQINSIQNPNYYLAVYSIVALIIKSWSDKNFSDN